VVTWLGTDAQPLVAADIAVVHLDHDPDLGRLSGEFTVRLPGANAAGRGLLTWHLALTRDAALAGPRVHERRRVHERPRLRPGAGQLRPRPGVARAHQRRHLQRHQPPPAASVDGLALLGTTGLGVSLRPTADAVERLFCYATTDAKPFRDLVLGGTVMANTG